MNCPIRITGQKPMHAQGDATPEDPALQIGLILIEDGVVGKTELVAAQAELHE